MSINFLYAIIAVFIISAVSLVGVVALAIKQQTLKKIIQFMVAFSVGALIGNAFLHLLPESIEISNNFNQIAVSIFIGILAFFVLEKILRWRHCHDISCHQHSRHIGVINLVGDGFHNLIDGILIGSSFAVSVPLGIATSIAVLVHEIPQELGDFSVIVHSGFTVKKALIWNFLSGSLAIFSAIIAFFVGQHTENFITFMIPFTIGTFIYIAMSDLIPELHYKNSFTQTIYQLIGLSVGMGLMMLLLVLE